MTRHHAVEGPASGVGATVLRWPELATPEATPVFTTRRGR